MVEGVRDLHNHGATLVVTIILLSLTDKVESRRPIGVLGHRFINKVGRATNVVDLLQLSGDKICG